LARRVTEKEVNLVVMIIPDQLQVEDDEAGNTPQDAEARALFSWVQDALTRKLGDAGVETVDLLPVLRRHRASKKRLYRKGDTHCLR